MTHVSQDRGTKPDLQGLRWFFTKTFQAQFLPRFAHLVSPAAAESAAHGSPAQLIAGLYQLLDNATLLDLTRDGPDFLSACRRTFGGHKRFVVMAVDDLIMVGLVAWMDTYQAYRIKAVAALPAEALKRPEDFGLGQTGRLRLHMTKHALGQLHTRFSGLLSPDTRHRPLHDNSQLLREALDLYHNGDALAWGDLNPDAHAWLRERYGADGAFQLCHNSGAVFVGVERPDQGRLVVVAVVPLDFVPNQNTARAGLEVPA